MNAQDNAAATAYFYHLAGMNLDAWDYQHPSISTNGCVRSIWKMVCNTYFPKQGVGCIPGQAVPYLRPCGDVCEQYTKACDVQCCDESTKCIFERTAPVPVELG